jgi:sporulation protein YlmC with PRC-barrel domain
MAMTGEKNRLISADKVEGTAVYNPKGEDLGHISEIMIDKLSGEVAYAVLKYGSVMGIGGKLFAVPWDILKYNTRLGGYVVDIPEERLKNAPSFDANNPPDMADVSWSKQIHDYYGSSARWYETT